jgi:glyoxylase-like metal-dependent hydrolase (beta-lactamase superfamily II)
MTLRRLTPSVSVLRADNPGPMTLDGTRSVVLRAPGAASCVVVDPGPDDAAHLDALADAGPVALVLITHRHADHTAGSPGLALRTGAPVRAADPAHCHGGDPLGGGETIAAAGLRVDVLATPGHTADSVSFVVTAPGEAPVVLTGDTVLGHGTTVLAEPDGSLADYLASLDALEAVGDGHLAVPAHGP